MNGIELILKTLLDSRNKREIRSIFSTLLCNGPSYHEEDEKDGDYFLGLTRQAKYEDYTVQTYTSNVIDVEEFSISRRGLTLWYVVFGEDAE